MSDFIPEEELHNLSAAELMKEANKYIYGERRNERKEEYPVLKYRRIKKIQYREVSVPPDILLRLANNEPFDYTYLRKNKDYK